MGIFNSDVHDLAAQSYVDAFVEFHQKKSPWVDVKKLSEEERQRYLTQAAQAHLLDDLYKNLDTLDQKAMSLLTFCGLVIAAAALLSCSAQCAVADNFRHALMALFVAAAASAVLCLSIIFVRWPSAASLRKVELVDECKSYYITRQHRTMVYVWAWLIMIAATIALAITVGVNLSLG